MNAFVSSIENCSVATSGWYPISDKLEITKLPIVDSSTGGYARLGQLLAEQFLDSIGARLPTLQEYDLLHAKCFHIEPYVLPLNSMTPGMSQEQIQAYRVQHMMTLDWCNLHDQEVSKLLENWDGSLPVDNAGKHWANRKLSNYNTLPKHGLIYGWWTPHARSYGVHNDFMIQTPDGNFHDELYVDYATTVHGVRNIQA